MPSPNPRCCHPERSEWVPVLSFFGILRCPQNDIDDVANSCAMVYCPRRGQARGASPGEVSRLKGARGGFRRRPRMTDAMGSRSDPKLRMRRPRMMLAAPPNLMLPRDNPPPQMHRLDSERVTYGVEAERVATILFAQDPPLGIDVQPARPREMGQHAFLIDVDRVGQQREHQALLAAQSMTARDVVVLARQDQVRSAGLNRRSA
jgi:hypothetical protein